LIGDHVRLKSGLNLGYIEDVIFSRDGTVRAVVVSPDVAYGGDGRYAFPLQPLSDAWDPSAAFLDLPLDRGQVAAMPIFDYGKLQTGGLADSQDRGASGPAIPKAAGGLRAQAGPEAAPALPQSD
jgi:hypothetical protein